MNVSTTVDKYNPTLVNPTDVPVGKVYSWGTKDVSYMRVREGSVCLGNWEFLPTTHWHFSSLGPCVEVAEKADLTLKYKG